MIKKKFIFICGNADSLVRFRSELVQELQKLDLQVYVMTGEVSPQFKKRLKKMNVALIPISFNRKSLNPFSSLLSMIDIIRKIRRISPSYVFSFTHKSVVIGSLCAYLTRVPNIFSMITGTGHIFDNFTLIEKVKRSFGLFGFRATLWMNSKVFFQNIDNQNLFNEHNLVKKNSCILINGSGVNLELFPVTELPSDPIFLCMSRLLRSKGLIEYAQAAKIIKLKNPKARFLLAGFADDHSDSISEEEIKTNWYKEYGIEFLGASHDPQRTIAESSVFILLSYNEGTPRSVLEAMSMGRPIVTTNVSGCRETVIDGYNGFLVDVQNPIAAADGFEKMLTSETRETFGKNSRKYCEEKFDSRAVNKTILSAMRLIPS